MMRRCVVLLIVLGMLEPALACEPVFPKPREIEVKIFEGIGGDCYYKLIPQPEQTKDWTLEESWRTEFYVSKNSDKPIFTKDFYFSPDITCLEDTNGQKHISYVNTNFYYDKILYTTYEPLPWLEFVVDGQTIKTYEALDIVKDDKNTLQVDYPCDGLTVLYIKSAKGFVLDQQSNHYIYQIETLNNHVLHFDLLTGFQVSTEQPLDVLLADAIRSEEIETVRSLLPRGADPNQGNPIDGLPIHLASRIGNIEIVRLLLESGAEADVQNVDPKLLRAFDDDYEGIFYHNPVYVAAESGDLAIIELLWGFGANINQPMLLQPYIFGEKKIALDVAITKNHIEVVRYLLEHGAEFSEDTLELAESSGNPEMIELVSSHTPH
jgi:hypothetical protein